MRWLRAALAALALLWAVPAGAECFANDTGLADKGGVLCSQNSFLFNRISGVDAGYSVRKLRSAYLGPAVNVRRTSDSAQKDIGFVGVHFDVGTFNTFCAATTCFVTKWYEQSVNAFHVLQATAANQPQIFSTGGGTRSRPRVHFTAASSQSLTIAGAAILPAQASAGADGGSTIYAVGTVTPAAGSLELLSNWDAANSGHAYYLGITTVTPTLRFGDGAGSAGTLATPGTTWQLTARKSPGSSPSAWLTRQAGAQIASGTSTNPAITNTIWAIGMQGDFGSEFWDGDIDEIIVTNSTSSIPAVESSQRAYFGTP